MALLERVATLVRANLNDLIDKAENPETMLKQVIVDMENQFLQVKTQVAISIADQHMLEKKQKENEEADAQWTRRAEMGIDRKDDPLARAALERAMGYRAMAASFQQQVADQKAQVDNLKTALLKLEQKLEEARARQGVLIAQHRRSRAMSRANEAQKDVGGKSHQAAFERMKNKVQHAEATVEAGIELNNDDVEGKFAALEKQDEIDRLLAEMKARRTGS
jgi:phage shock protein A